MTPLPDLIQQGAGKAWLYVPSAIALGALHGLEPGHSKTMMAAFIVAIRGTVAQAVLLGLSATLSHTSVVWAVALVGMHFGGQLNAETTEPYFQIASAVLIVSIALWMVWRTRRDQLREQAEADHDYVEDLKFVLREGPHAHDFVRRHGHHPHDQHHHHGHDHDHDHAHDAPQDDGLDLALVGYQDAHERAHANDIRRRFGNRDITTWQIVAFGLAGGLIPCPASITVLLLCLQLKQFTLGVMLVLCFSIGLAITMVLSGTLAALSVRHVSRRWKGFGTFARRAPYASSALIVAVGLYTGYLGWQGLHA